MSTALTKKKENSIQKTKPIMLNAEKRKLLISIVPNIIDMKKECEILEEKRELGKKLLTEYVRSFFPEEDIKVLRKYGLTRIIDSINVSIINHGQSYISIEKTEVSYEYSCYVKELRNLPENISSVLSEAFILDKQIKLEKQKKISAYTALINTSKTIDDLKVVWLDVENVIVEKSKGDPDIKSKIQNTFSKDEVVVIIEDVKRREENK